MSIAVHGAGAFGTALAIALSTGGAQVTLVARPDRAASLERARCNQRDLAGIAFPEGLHVIAPPTPLPPVDAHVIAVPAQVTAAYLVQAAIPQDGSAIVLAAKGIDIATGSLLSAACAGSVEDSRLAILSGPGFARELAQGLPTALTLAAADMGRTRQLQALLSTGSVRLYASIDRTGVQLGGALKNVVAIACGICAGAGLGESTRAALMTRGFAEIIRLGQALGAQPETFQGLSGLGDLALTAASPQSRNFRAGQALGRGEAMPSGTIEGIATARAALSLADSAGIELPVAQATVAIIDGTLAISDAMTMLLARPLKEETDP